MEEDRPGYYAIIPADVRYDDRIPPNAKLLYGEISALIGKDGYCFAANEYFCNVYGFSDATITRLISDLVKHDYVVREFVRDASGKITMRKLYLKVSMPDVHPPLKNDGTPHQNCGEGTLKNEGYTNTSITDIKKENKKEKSGKAKPEPLTDEQLQKAVIAGITKLAAPGWSPEVKNTLFLLILQLYDPQRVVKKAHPVRSQLSVDGTFRKLAQAKSPQMMVDMLNSAIIGGWQGVQLPSGINREQAPTEERQYVCV